MAKGGGGESCQNIRNVKPLNNASQVVYSHYNCESHCAGLATMMGLPIPLPLHLRYCILDHNTSADPLAHIPPL